MDGRSDSNLHLLGKSRNREDIGYVHRTTSLPGQAASSVSASPSLRVSVTPTETSQQMANIEMLATGAAHVKSEKWRIYWLNPTAMLSFLLLGIVCAVAHHLYYMSLDQSSVDAFNQEWAVRIGTALAFLTRAFLVGSAAMGLQQYSWLILRRTPLSIGAIDDLIGVLGDLIPFINFELWRRAFGGLFVGLVIW